MHSLGIIKHARASWLKCHMTASLSKSTRNLASHLSLSLVPNHILAFNRHHDDARTFSIDVSAIFHDCISLKTAVVQEKYNEQHSGTFNNDCKSATGR
jgi:hypothetical protein